MSLLVWMLCVVLAFLLQFVVGINLLFAEYSTIFGLGNKTRYIWVLYLGTLAVFAYIIMHPFRIYFSIG